MRTNFSLLWRGTFSSWTTEKVLFYINSELSFLGTRRYSQRSCGQFSDHRVVASDQKYIYILYQSQTFFARPKDDLNSVKLVFVLAQKFLEEALNAIKFLKWLKTFGPAQNILGPVKGQSISIPFKIARCSLVSLVTF